MTQPDLLEHAARTVADTSLMAYAAILPTLSQREQAVFLALCDYCDQHSQSDATGGELAAFMGTLTTSVRPRITGLHRKGLVLRTNIRPSRAQYESTCHGYAPAVPREAVERMAKIDVVASRKEAKVG